MHFFLVNDYCRVTSSEKVDKIQRYSDFYLCSVPYPGMLHWEFWHLSIIFVLPRMFLEYFFSFILMYFLLLQVVNFLETLRTMSTMQKVYILIGNRWEIKRFFLGTSFPLLQDDKLHSSQTYCLTVCMILVWLFFNWLLDCPANILS